MGAITKQFWFKTICAILTFTFVALDISYAYPPEYNARNSTLATPSNLQQSPVDENAARSRRSMLSESALLDSVLDTGELSNSPVGCTRVNTPRP
jgi:hypothetical protein